MDQAAKLRELMGQQRTYTEGRAVQMRNAAMRIIAVTSGKGGVGKSNFSVNLAIQLQKAGKSVIIVDADFGLANVEVLMDVRPKYSFRDVVNGTVDIQTALAEGPGGVRFLSGGSGLAELANVNEVQLQLLLDSMAALDGMADVLLIDTGAGITKSVTHFLKAANEIVVVTTAEPTSITDAYAIIKILMDGNPNPPELKIVVNRVDSVEEGKDVFRRLQRVCAKFLGIQPIELGSIPYDRNLVRAVKAQEPVALLFPNADSTKSIEVISQRLLRNGAVDEKTGGMKKFLQRWVGFMRT